ncbi:sugar-binding protein [Capilliphycus salinus ALCB114379]|uniref:WD40 domain-containing protein n=1 Tax=Capilliphycus salinus TaxID=2768948 RepID=UPI0039A464DE
MNNNETVGKNQRSLKTLLRIINNFSDEFSLVFACCNYRILRDKAMRTLRKKCLLEIEEITLDIETKTLYTTIKKSLDDKKPNALMIFGLESVNNIEEVLKATNQIREEFSQFKFPLIIWIDDRLLQMMIRLVPDFHSWATTVEFVISKKELLKFIQKTTDDVFQTLSDSGASIFLEDSSFKLEKGSPLRNELELAQEDICKRQIQLDIELAASLEFVLGRITDNSTDIALKYYEKSLALWEQTDNLERWGYILFYLGFWWHSYGFLNHSGREESYLTAKNYYRQSLDQFKQANRLDLVSKFINALGLVLERLKHWDELEDVAKKAVGLHKVYSHPFRQARGYHFLAEVALAKENWKKAKKLAEKSLSIFEQEVQERLTKILHEEDTYLTWEKSFHQAWYLFCLGKAQQQLGEIYPGIQTLQLAQKTAKPEYDPELYVEILNKLHELYFDSREYLLAFKTKQKRREIQQQFGLRAFIGAGRLVHSQSIRNPGLPSVEKNQKINPEIAASGRVKHLEKLIKRIYLNDRKLIVIHGHSGVGKSSIIQAGLIPKLKNLLVEERRVIPVLQRYYTNWIQTLSYALGEAFSSLTSIKIDPNRYQNLDEIQTELQNSLKHNLLIVLIFDQFEEFFFVCKEPEQRKQFYQFLKFCLDTPFIKVVLSLRQDYLHYLLEGNRLKYFDAINDNVLDKNILYHIGNFSPDEAKSVIKTLTETTQIIPETALINELVKDLAHESNEVRPIELQVVGAQLQAMEITTLEQYQREGPTRKLVEQYLEEVITECGYENKQLAELVLYLLTDENNTRPLKTRLDLLRELKELAHYLDQKIHNLDTVLEIFVASGLVCLLPEIPVERYQLVHDYLVSFIRQQRSAEIITQLEHERRKRREAEDKLNQVLQQRLEEAQANIKRKKNQLILSLSASLAMVILSASVIFSTLTVRQQKTQLRNQNIETANFNYTAFLIDNNQIEASLSILRGAKYLRESFTESSLEQETLHKLWAVLNLLQERNRLEGNLSGEIGVSVSPDGQLIASAGEDKKIKLWKLTGELVQTIEGHKEPILYITFSPDGEIIASASEDKTIKLWKRDGTFIRTIPGHENVVQWVSFSPDGQQIASASRDQTVKLWTVEGTLITTLKGHQSSVSSVIFSPDGERIVSAEENGTLNFWNDKGERLNSFKAHQQKIWSLAFSPDGQTIASASGDGTVKLWNRQGELLNSLEEHKYPVYSVSYSPDGEGIASADFNGTIMFWSREGILKTTVRGHRNVVNNLSFTPDSQMLVSASRDSTVKIWNLNGIPQVFQPNQKIYSPIFSPDGEIIASVSAKNQVILWKIDRRIEKQLPDNLTKQFTFTDHDGIVNNISFSPDGKIIASASRDRTVKLWNLRGEVIKNLPHNAPVWTVKFSRDGTLIATASEDRIVRLWDNNGQLLHTLKGHQKRINDLSFSSDGLLASASDDNTIILWNRDGEMVQKLVGDGSKFSSVSFSPIDGDEKLIVAATTDRSFNFWTGQGKNWKRVNTRTTIGGHTGAIYQVSFSPNGEIIASASGDGTVKLWDRYGNLISTLRVGSAQMLSVNFSPDNQTLIATDQLNRVIFWKLDQSNFNNIDDLLQQICNQFNNYLKYNPTVEQKDKVVCEKFDSN